MMLFWYCHNKVTRYMVTDDLKRVNRCEDNAPLYLAERYVGMIWCNIELHRCRSLMIDSACRRLSKAEAWGQEARSRVLYIISISDPSRDFLRCPWAPSGTAVRDYRTI